MQSPAAPIQDDDHSLSFDPYETWKQNPSRENLRGVVDYLKPTISRTLHSIGGADDKYLATNARVLAAQAVETYDPAYGAKLQTWVDRQLQPLRRLRRSRQQVLRVPDSVQLNAYSIFRAEQEFADEHGRDPDVAELADLVNMPVKRIEKVRRSFSGTLADGQVSTDAAEEGRAGFNVAHSTHDVDTEAMDYVHAESDHVDRKILEYKTGYGGGNILPGPEIAAKLGLSPVQLSRRSARINLKINQYKKLLEAP